MIMLCRKLEVTGKALNPCVCSGADLARKKCTETEKYYYEAGCTVEVIQYRPYLSKTSINNTIRMYPVAVEFCFIHWQYMAVDWLDSGSHICVFRGLMLLNVGDSRCSCKIMMLCWILEVKHCMCLFRSKKKCTEKNITTGTAPGAIHCDFKLQLK